MSPLIGEGLTSTDCENAVLAQLAGNPEWVWQIEIKHAVAGTMNGHQFHVSVNRLIEAGQIERTMVGGKGWRIRLGRRGLDPRAGGADVSASEGGSQ